MAVNRYIGARYVPKFMGAWQLSVTYEPLSIVTHNGISYTSKKLVPANTPLPDGTDTEFWAITGITDAQILQILTRLDTLDQEYASADALISALQSDVSSLQSDVTSLQSDTSTLETNLTSVTERVSALESAAETAEILIVSDSYGLRKTNNKTFADLLQDRVPYKTIHMVALGSAGFASTPKFSTVLDSFTGDRSKIEQIIIVGGANDIGVMGMGDETAARADCQAFMDIVYSDFPKAKVYMFECGMIMSDVWHIVSRSRFYEKYNNILMDFNITPISNSQYVLQNTTLLETDYVHPNASGLNAITDYLIPVVNGAKSIDVRYVLPISGAAGADMASISLAPDGVMILHNNVISMNGSGLLSMIGTGTFNAAKAIGYNGFVQPIQLDIANLTSGTLVDCATGTSHGVVFTTPCKLTTSAGVKICDLMFAITRAGLVRASIVTDVSVANTVTATEYMSLDSNIAILI